MKNAVDPQIFCDLHKHECVFDIDDLLSRYLSDAQREPKNVRVGLAESHKARGYERIHKSIQLERANAIVIYFARFEIMAPAAPEFFFSVIRIFFFLRLASADESTGINLRP